MSEYHFDGKRPPTEKINLNDITQEEISMHYNEMFCAREFSAQVIVEDLKRYCKIGQSPLSISKPAGVADMHVTAANIGRQEVFYYIISRISRVNKNQADEIVSSSS
jgi:hypothetical protein